MDSGLRDPYRVVMEADMADSDSQRYRLRFEQRQWAWQAEAALCNAQWQGDTDFSSLFTNLGGWYERTDGGTVSDEIVAFAPIATDSGPYDPLSYQPGTDTLLLRQRADYQPFSWTMPDSSVIETREPAGELLQRTASILLVLWRDIGWAGGDVYQAAAYRLDEDGLTIKWGPFAETSARPWQPYPLSFRPSPAPKPQCSATTTTSSRATDSLLYGSTCQAQRAATWTYTHC